MPVSLLVPKGGGVRLYLPLVVTHTKSDMSSHDRHLSNADKRERWLAV